MFMQLKLRTHTQFSTRYMSLTRQDVEKIANLARLSITEQEMPVYVTSLSSIVNFVDELSRAQTGDVEPMAHPLDGLHGSGYVRTWSPRPTSMRSTRRMRPACKPACTWCRE